MKVSAKLILTLGVLWLVGTVVWAAIDYAANNFMFPDTAGNFGRHLSLFIISGLLALIVVVLGFVLQKSAKELGGPKR